MLKINDIKTINIVAVSLVIVTILALGIFFMPKDAFAQEGGSNYVWNSTVGINNPPTSTNTYQNGMNNTYNPYNQNNYYPTPAQFQPTQTVYVPTNTTSTQTAFVDTPTIYSGTVAKTTTKKSTVAKVTPTKANTLAANVVFGENKFMPSGILEWMFFGIIILIIVILTRRVFSRNKEFEKTPLKHA